MDSSDLKNCTETPDLDFKWLKQAANGNEELLKKFVARRQKGEPVAKIIYGRTASGFSL